MLVSAASALHFLVTTFASPAVSETTSKSKSEERGISFSTQWSTHHHGGGESRYFKIQDNGDYRESDGHLVTKKDLQRFYSIIAASRSKKEPDTYDFGFTDKFLLETNFLLKEYANDPEYAEVLKILRRFKVRVGRNDVGICLKELLGGWSSDRRSASIGIHDGQHDIVLSFSGPMLWVNCPWEVQVGKERWVSYCPQLNIIARHLSKTSQYDFLCPQTNRLSAQLSPAILTRAEEKLVEKGNLVINSVGKSELLASGFHLNFEGIYGSNPTYYAFKAMPIAGSVIDAFSWQVESHNSVPVADFGHFSGLIKESTALAKSIKWLGQWKSSYPRRTIEISCQTPRTQFALLQLEKMWRELGLQGKPTTIIQLKESLVGVILLGSVSEDRLMLCLDGDFNNWSKDSFKHKTNGGCLLVGKESLPAELRGKLIDFPSFGAPIPRRN